MPVTLADIGGLFAVGFLLISFIGWIINLINQQNPPPAPNRGPERRPRARDRKVQNEIEQFLQEAMGNKGGGQRQEVRADEIEVLEPAPTRRPPPRRRPRPVAPPQSPAAAPPPRRVKPGSEVTSRHVLPSEALGAGVTSHLQSHMQERVGQEIQQHLPHAVDQTVRQHLGDFSAGDQDPRKTVKPTYRSRANVPDPNGLIADLRTPGGMRKAVLLQEVLAKPRILRK